MAVPSFIAASTGATDATGAWTATCHAPGAAGRVIILQIVQDGANTSPTLDSATNIENLAGTDNAWTSIGEFTVGGASQASQHLWIGRALSTSAPTATGSNAGGDDLYWRFYEFSDVSAGATLDTVIENSSAGATVVSSGTSATIADASVTTLGVDRLVLNFLAGNDDNAIDPFTGMTGGGWIEVPEYADSAGTDGVVQLQYGRIGIAGNGLSDNTLGVFGEGGAGERLAQSFTTTGAATVTAVLLEVLKVLAPTDNLLVEIQTDSSGAPSGTVVGTSGSVAGASLSTTRTWVSFSVGASLSAATLYWLVIRRDGARDVTNYYDIRARTIGSVYSGGQKSIRSSGTWTADSTADLCFLVATDVAGTIDGGTDGWADATDSWGVVGFALIGTTSATPTSLLPSPIPQAVPRSLYVR